MIIVLTTIICDCVFDIIFDLWPIFIMIMINHASDDNRHRNLTKKLKHTGHTVGIHADWPALPLVHQDFPTVRVQELCAGLSSCVQRNTWSRRQSPWAVWHRSNGIPGRLARILQLRLLSCARLAHSAARNLAHSAARNNRSRKRYKLAIGHNIAPRRVMQ